MLKIRLCGYWIGLSLFLLAVYAGSTRDVPGQYIRRDRPQEDQEEPAIRRRPVRPDPDQVPEVAPPDPISRRPPEARTAQPATRPRVEAEPADEEEDEPQDARVEVDADRMEYDADRRVMVAIGNVVVRQLNDVLYADYLEVHPDTQEVLARGNIYFERGGTVWEGEELAYNFQTGEGDFGDFKLFTDPHYIRAAESKQMTPDMMELRRVSWTTCAEDEWQEFVMTSPRATIEDRSILRARHVVARLYGVPIFYTPYLKKDFRNPSNFDIVPGYSSRMGAFLLTGYNWYPTDHLKATTQLDYRTKRGVAVGQRVRWRLPGNQAQGRVQAYYADDQNPIQGDSQTRLREGLVENDRYWLGLRHNQTLGLRNSLMTDINYLSDPFILEDYFDDDFRRNVQPENRVTLTHRGDGFTAALLLNRRLNDFFGNVNRLPEGSLDINTREIGSTGFYYESEHSAVSLERVFPEQSEEEEYDSIRVDSLNTVLYPMRHFGFLSVIPSVSYRGTWYSETPGAATTTTNLVARLDEEGEMMRDEDGVVLFDEEEETTVEEGSAEFRNLMEYRIETSFKAFKVLNEYPNYMGEGLRHVAEPYVRYRLVPEPNIEPNELYQFDSIDRLGERHDIQLGMRNKLQTRRRGGRTVDIRTEQYGRIDALEEEEEEEEVEPRIRIHDFIDLDTYTIYRVDPGPDENDFDDFFFDLRLRLATWMTIDTKGSYDWYDSELSRVNTRATLRAPDRSSLSLEHRYDRDRRQTLQTRVHLFPRDRWSYEASWRYDIEEGDLDEQRYIVQRRFDCTMLGVGVRGRLDSEDEMEWRAWAQITLLAFPQMELQLGR